LRLSVSWIRVTGLMLMMLVHDILVSQDQLFFGVL
jgi:hypothetical protein